MKKGQKDKERYRGAQNKASLLHGVPGDFK